MSISKCLGISAVVVTAMTVMQKFFGLLKEMVLAYFYGTSAIVDALSMASSTTEICMGFVTAISIVFLPIYSKVCKEEDDQSGVRFINQSLTLTLILGGCLGLLMISFAQPILAIVAPGFSEENRLVVSHFLVYAGMAIIMLSMQATLNHFLNYHGAYILTALSGLIVSPMQMVAIIFSVFWGENWLVLFFMLPQFLSLVFTWVAARRYGFRFSLSLRPLDRCKKVLFLLAPIFLSSSIQYINTAIDKIFASYLTQGSVAALQYGFTLRTMFIAVFAAAFSSMVFPMLSKAVAQQNHEQIGSTIQLGINYISILFVPLTAAICLLARPMIQLLYGGGAFDATSMQMTTGTTICYCLGLCAVAAREFLSQVYYAMEQTRQLVITRLVTIAVNVAGNFLLIRWFQASGLALATSLSVACTVPAMYFPLRRSMHNLPTRHMAVTFFKCVLSSLCMSVVVYLCRETVFPVFGDGKLGLLVSLLIAAAIGSGLYFIVLYWLHVSEIQTLWQMARRMLIRQRR